MSDDIVDKLRLLGTGCVGTISGHHAPLMNEAADELARLRAENERLLAENEWLSKSLAAWQEAAIHGHPSPCNMGPLCPYCEIDTLRAENEKLQELLLGR